MIPFTVGALGCAALLGLGNGAVFKLVPQYFPNQTGTVTGLVGAMGGLGGFFPPLLLAFFRSFLPVRPGTDLALLMAMLHVIVRDGLTDRDFIEAHTTGFEKTAESVEPWNPRRAAEVTGVAPDAIERAAHWVGESRRAMLMHARGLERHSKGVENCEAVAAIALVTGNIGREGAGPIMVTGQGNGQGGRERGQKCDQLPGQRSLTDPAAREHVGGVWVSHRTNCRDRVIRQSRS
jgi:anaerobic selenocysteine-containing dehydrogenase